MRGCKDAGCRISEFDGDGESLTCLESSVKMCLSGGGEF
jgi:hypothetical protein